MIPGALSFVIRNAASYGPATPNRCSSWAVNDRAWACRRSCRTSAASTKPRCFVLTPTSMASDGSIDGSEGEKKKIVFLGTPYEAAISLELLLQASRDNGTQGPGFEIVRVVSNPPARAGRQKTRTPCPVQSLAENEGIAVMTPITARDEAFLEEFEALQPDLCITSAYGQFLPQRFLNIPKFGTLNVHPSLLPRYRGASPVQRCLEAGETETGVTVAFTVLKMDAGPIVRQKVRENLRHTTIPAHDEVLHPRHRFGHR